MKRTVLIFRTECAVEEIEANSPEEAKQIMIDRINTADCIADLDLEWDIDGGMKVDTEAPSGWTEREVERLKAITAPV